MAIQVQNQIIICVDGNFFFGISQKRYGVSALCRLNRLGQSGIVFSADRRHGVFLGQGDNNISALRFHNSVSARHKVIRRIFRVTVGGIIVNKGAAGDIKRGIFIILFVQYPHTIIIRCISVEFATFNVHFGIFPCAHTN